MRFKSMAKGFEGTVKEVVGTAFSVGCVPQMMLGWYTALVCLRARDAAPLPIQSYTLPYLCSMHPPFSCLIDGKHPREITAAIDAGEVVLPTA